MNQGSYVFYLEIHSLSFDDLGAAYVSSVYLLTARHWICPITLWDPPELSPMTVYDHHKNLQGKTASPEDYDDHSPLPHKSTLRVRLTAHLTYQASKMS